MNALQLYKFVTENKLEFHWNERRIDRTTETKDVILFINGDEIKEFTDLLGYSAFDDGGIECTLKSGYIAIWMQDICDRYGIEITEIFGEFKLD